MIRHLYYWLLDYAYALKWQLRALSSPPPPAYQPAGHQSQIPIILIPGVYEPWLFMKPLADALQAAGHPVLFVTELGYHTMHIPIAAQTVRRLIDQHHLTQAVIVAHSKGGLVGKYFLSHYNPDHAVTRVIALHTPFSGSVYARAWLLQTVRVFSPRSPLIRELMAEASVNADIVSIYGHFDPHIPSGSHLEGAANLRLLTMGHFRILNLPEVKQAVLHWIDANR